MKQKSHSGAKKRFRTTGRGKLKMKKSCKNHLLTHKSKRQKMLEVSGKSVASSDQKNIRNLLNISHASKSN